MHPRGGRVVHYLIILAGGSLLHVFSSPTPAAAGPSAPSTVTTATTDDPIVWFHSNRRLCFHRFGFRWDECCARQNIQQSTTPGDREHTGTTSGDRDDVLEQSLSPRQENAGQDKSSQQSGSPVVESTAGEPDCWDDLFNAEACCWQSPEHEETEIRHCFGGSATYCWHMLDLMEEYQRLNRACLKEVDHARVGVSAPASEEILARINFRGERGVLGRSSGENLAGGGVSKNRTRAGKTHASRIQDSILEIALRGQQGGGAGPTSRNKPWEQHQPVDLWSLARVFCITTREYVMNVTMHLGRTTLGRAGGHLLGEDKDVVLNYWETVVPVVREIVRESFLAPDVTFDAPEGPVRLYSGADLRQLVWSTLVLDPGVVGHQPGGRGKDAEQIKYLDVLGQAATVARYQRRHAAQLTEAISSLGEGAGEQGADQLRRERGFDLHLFDFQFSKFVVHIKSVLDRAASVMERFVGVYFGRLRSFLVQGCAEDVCSETVMKKLISSLEGMDEVKSLPYVGGGSSLFEGGSGVLGGPLLSAEILEEDMAEKFDVVGSSSSSGGQHQEEVLLGTRRAQSSEKPTEGKASHSDHSSSTATATPRPLPEHDLAALVFARKPVVHPNCARLRRAPALVSPSGHLWPPPDFVPPTLKHEFLLHGKAELHRASTYYAQADIEQGWARSSDASGQRLRQNVPSLETARSAGEEQSTRSATGGDEESETGGVEATAKGGLGTEKISDADWSRKRVEHFVRTQNLTEIPASYGEQEKQLQFFTQQRDVLQNKHVLVVGSERPWLEALLLRVGAATVTTLDYRAPVVDDPHPQLKFLHFSDVVGYSSTARSSAGNQTHNYEEDSTASRTTSLSLQFDAAFSYSSLEHAGLGRYGDLINPWADVQTGSLVCFVW